MTDYPPSPQIWLRRDKMDLWIAGLLGLSSRKTIDLVFQTVPAD
jgi:hypothetical protein